MPVREDTEAQRRKKLLLSLAKWLVVGFFATVAATSLGGVAYLVSGDISDFDVMFKIGIAIGLLAVTLGPAISHTEYVFGDGRYAR